MSKPVFYRQCKPRRGNKHTTSFLPERYAIQDKYVKLKRDDGTWEDGWQVVSVGSMHKPEEDVRLAERDHLRTREASDV